MVGNEQQPAALQFQIDPAGGVGEHDRLHPKATQYAYAEYDLPRCVALVQRSPARHHHNLEAIEAAKDQTPRMSDSRRTGPIGDFGVGNLATASQFIGKSPQPAPEHQCDSGLAAVNPGFQEIRRLPDHTSMPAMQADM